MKIYTKATKSPSQGLYVFISALKWHCGFVNICPACALQTSVPYRVSVAVVVLLLLLAALHILLLRTLCFYAAFPNITARNRTVCSPLNDFQSIHK